MVEIAFTLSLSDLVKVIHIEQNKGFGYLPDERGVVAVLEV